jgi:ATP adenylyltransferase/5',5'''-P-1,P-4-tetraphosphate phosphorylase II
LGYLGLFFVKDDKRKEILQQRTPIDILSQLAVGTYAVNDNSGK